MHVITNMLVVLKNFICCSLLQIKNRPCHGSCEKHKVPPALVSMTSSLFPVHLNFTCAIFCFIKIQNFRLGSWLSG